MKDNYQYMKAASFVLLILSAAISIIVFESFYENRFYPGVFIGGEAVGGKIRDEVMKDFQTRAETLAENGLQLSFEGEKGKREIDLPMSNSGLTADNIVEYFSLGDWAAAVEEAFQWGRSGSVFRKAWQQFSLVFRPKYFELPSAIHEEPIRSLLSRELKDFFREAMPARFAPYGLGVIIREEKSGEGVNLERLLGTLRVSMASMRPTPHNFKALPHIPAVTREQLEPFLDFANQLARSTQVVFSYQTKRWRVSGQTLASWLTWDDGSMGVDLEKLQDYLSETIAPVLDDPPQNGRFEMRNGALVEIVPGKAGNVVDVKKTAAKVDRIFAEAQKSFAVHHSLSLALAAVAPSTKLQPRAGDVEIPIETIQAEPRINQRTINNYKIKDLVGYARTSFKGSSADRRHNIEQGVANLNGLLLPPGGEFSAVNAIGEVTEEAGFVKEYVIKETKSVKELGGGLCQIATTLFRLALDAGLPITERTNHRYVVSYYGPGLDATIYGPHPDLRFVNDTDNHILLQGRTEGDEVIFEFYGQRDGRVAHVSDPVLSEEKPAPPAKYLTAPDLPIGTFQCSETPRRGMTADVTYTVQYPDGSVNEQQFHSVYQPWQKICLIGTALIK